MPKNKKFRNCCCPRFFKTHTDEDESETVLLAYGDPFKDGSLFVNENANNDHNRKNYATTPPKVAYGFTIFMLVVMMLESTTENMIGMQGNLLQNNNSTYNNSTSGNPATATQYPSLWLELALATLLSLLISVPQILLFGRRKIFKYIERLDNYITNEQPRIHSHKRKIINCTSYFKAPLYITLYAAAGTAQYFLIAYQARTLAKDAFSWEKNSWQSDIFANILAGVGTGYIALTEQAEIIKAAFQNISDHALGKFTSFLNRLLCCFSCCVPATLIFGKIKAALGATQHGLMEGLALYALLMTWEFPMAVAIVFGALMLTGASIGNYLFEGEELIKNIKKIILNITDQEKTTAKTEKTPLSNCKKKLLYGFAGFLIILTFAGHVALSAVTLENGFKDFYKGLYGEDLSPSSAKLAKTLCLVIGFFPAIWDLMTEGVEIISHARKRAMPSSPQLTHA